MGKLFIQIGAGAGDRDSRANYRDGFSEYVKKINPAEIDRIILVEPNPMNIEELKICWKDYPQAEILQIGICAHTPEKSKETFYFAEEDLPHYQVFSIKEAHVKKHYPNGTIRSIDVEIYSINQFLEKFVGDTRIDILSLDIEGIDAETILAVKWNQLNCFQISFEHLHLGDLGVAVLRHLGNSGYMYVGNGLDANGFDLLYEKIQKHSSQPSPVPAFSKGRQPGALLMSNPLGKLQTEELKSITAPPISPEEQIMLDNVAEIESLMQMLPLEPLALYRLCKMLPENSKILEIGSYQGGSTVAIGHAIAGTNKSLYCLDPWQGYLNQEDFADFDKSKIKDDFAVFNNFLRNTSFIGENLRVLRGKSTSFADLLAGKEFDLIFIDGAYDYMSVRTDIIIAFSAIRAGGIICGHDYHTDGHGVVRAVNELIHDVPSIQTKHVIDETTIWFCMLEDPGYEYIMTDISDLCNAGKLAEALQKSKNAYLKYKSEELANFVSSLESVIHKNQ